ncbi:hypothetical protein VTJ49DRAFT_6779 [Mycothermus thermophilus]|uniref:Myb-like domain-containing protein n=1 Tax=Humicola insolens TaxID=85995 RepID=A0ABR3V0W6_HUMIN
MTRTRAPARRPSSRGTVSGRGPGPGGPSLPGGMLPPPPPPPPPSSEDRTRSGPYRLIAAHPPATPMSPTSAEFGVSSTRYAPLAPAPHPGPSPPPPRAPSPSPPASQPPASARRPPPSVYHSQTEANDPRHHIHQHQHHQQQQQQQQHQQQPPRQPDEGRSPADDVLGDDPDAPVAALAEYPYSIYNHGTWSAEDDKTLVAARAQGLNWADLQRTHFPGKTANACRKRYERLVERRGIHDYGGRRLERVANEYMNMRREIWSGLADRLGMKWDVVEALCMGAGLRTIQSNARSYTNRARRDVRISQKTREAQAQAEAAAGGPLNLPLPGLPVGSEFGTAFNTAHPPPPPPRHEHDQRLADRVSGSNPPAGTGVPTPGPAPPPPPRGMSDRATMPPPAFLAAGPGTRPPPPPPNGLLPPPGLPPPSTQHSPPPPSTTSVTTPTTTRLPPMILAPQDRNMPPPPPPPYRGPGGGGGGYMPNGVAGGSGGGGGVPRPPYAVSLAPEPPPLGGLGGRPPDW